jgi:hypothetical protein
VVVILGKDGGPRSGGLEIVTGAGGSVVKISLEIQSFRLSSKHLKEVIFKK